MSDDYEREVREIFRSPRVYVRDIDWEAGRALCVNMSRESYARSAFLDERTVSEDGGGDRVIPLRAIVEAWRAAPPEPRPIAFIGHMAVSGSTFLARALDVPGRTMVYKEPYLLHKLAGAWRTGRQRLIQEALGYADPSVLELTLSLVQRGFEASERPVVKLTDSGASLLPAALRARPGSRVLLLYQDLRRYLAAMLKRPERVQHARNMVDRSSLDLVAAGRPDLVVRGALGDGRCVAYAWLGLIVPFGRLTAAGPTRVRSLAADRLLETPEEAVSAASRFLRLGMGRQAIVARLSAGLMDADAKDPDAAFDRDQRRSEIEDAYERYREEIEDAVAWVEELSRAEPVPDKLPGELLPG